MPYASGGEAIAGNPKIDVVKLQHVAARLIGEMIHDADLEDGKFQRSDCFGLDRILKGWARLGSTDQEILAKGFECFDALYAVLKPR